SRLALEQPSAIVFACDPERSSPMRSTYLQELYGLTAAEAAVAVETSRGEGMHAVSAAMGVSVTTAKTHLCRVFEKTGTRRQAELVRLMTAGHAGLRIE